MDEKVQLKEYDGTGNGNHYKKDRIDCMYVFEKSFGTLALMTFCEMNALKYRMRIGNKSQPLEQELVKIRWYEKAARLYEKKLGTKEEILIDNTTKKLLYL